MWTPSAWAGVVVEREASVGLPDERGWEPQVAHSTEVCDGSRCRHVTEAIGVFPAMVVYSDLDAGTAWWFLAPGVCARLDDFAGADRIWGVDLFEPPEFRLVAEPPPAGLGAGVTGWTVEKPGGIHVTVWVQPGLPLGAADFARRTAVRLSPGAASDGVVAALRALPGYPVEVRSGAPYRPGASTDVRVRVTRMAEVAVDPADVTLPACREVPEGRLLQAVVTGERIEPEPEPPASPGGAQTEVWTLRNTADGLERRRRDPEVLFPGVGIGPVTLGTTRLRDAARELPADLCHAVVEGRMRGQPWLWCSDLRKRHELLAVETPSVAFRGTDGVIDEAWTQPGSTGAAVHTPLGVTIGLTAEEAEARMGCPPDARGDGSLTWSDWGLELQLDGEGRVERMRSWAIEGAPP